MNERSFVHQVYRFEEMNGYLAKGGFTSSISLINLFTFRVNFPNIKYFWNHILAAMDFMGVRLRLRLKNSK